MAPPGLRGGVDIDVMRRKSTGYSLEGTARRVGIAAACAAGLLAGGLSLILMLPGCDPLPEMESAGSAEGLWTGSTSTGRTLTTAVPDGSTYYFFYTLVGDPNQIAGVIQGTGTSDAGDFSSANAKDFGIGTTVLDASVAATYGAQQSLNGSVTYSGGGMFSFTHTYSSAYDTQPPLGSVAGVYQAQVGRSIGYETATLTVSSDGTYSGSEQNGCTFTGRITSRARGNVFDNTIAFGGAPCFFGTETFQGVWYLDIPTQRLYAAAINGARTDAAILFAVKIL